MAPSKKRNESSGITLRGVSFSSYLFEELWIDLHSLTSCLALYILSSFSVNIPSIYTIPY
jgi:hypothetical protein